MLKKMVSLALAAAMASTMLLSVGAAEIMPLAGSECPYCGYEGYGYQYRYGNWNLVDPVRCGHGAGSLIQDSVEVRVQERRMGCVNHSCNFTAENWKVIKTEKRVYCNYLNKYYYL